MSDVSDDRRTFQAVCAVVVALLVVFSLSVYQIDRFFFGSDAIHTLDKVGLFAEGAYSALDVLDNIHTQSPDQGPLYYLLLNIWGNLVGHEIAAVRMFTVFFALLSLAMVYRLARDTISPIAGSFALLIMASNAFYNLYYAHLRFYTLLVFLATLVLWLYLRITDMEGPTKRRDLIALLCACAALVSTHAFGLLLYIVLALYHLLLVRKDRRWLAVVAVAVAGLLLATPLIFVMLTKGVGFAVAGHGPRADSPGEILTTWFTVTMNGSALLLVLAGIGAAVGWRRHSLGVRRSARLFALLIVAIFVTTLVTGTLDAGLMRHLLVGMPIAVLFQAAGLYALYRMRKPLALLVCLWAFAGLSFARTADWLLYVQGRMYSFQEPPWHLVSRQVLQPSDQGHVIGYMVADGLMFKNETGTGKLRKHWFVHRNINFQIVGAPTWLDEHLRLCTESCDAPWLVYQTTTPHDLNLEAANAVMNNLGYSACRHVKLPVRTVMTQFSWISLDCQPAQLSVSNQVEPLSYDFFGAEVAEDGSRLFVANRWTAQSDQPIDHLRISHQLLSRDWHNVAQVDGPPKFEGDLRQYSMDISAVAPGQYRLVAIVYDRFTGVALDWQTPPGNPPSMLLLGEIEIR